MNLILIRKKVIKGNVPISHFPFTDILINQRIIQFSVHYIDIGAIFNYPNRVNRVDVIFGNV
jgi:hypothetical protein